MAKTPSLANFNSLDLIYTVSIVDASFSAEPTTLIEGMSGSPWMRVDGRIIVALCWSVD